MAKGLHYTAVAALVDGRKRGRKGARSACDTSPPLSGSAYVEATPLLMKKRHLGS
jgi:hypothetical protein